VQWLLTQHHDEVSMLVCFSECRACVSSFSLFSLLFIPSINLPLLRSLGSLGWVGSVSDLTVWQLNRHACHREVIAAISNLPQPIAEEIEPHMQQIHR
jgi:hypothetical protein